MPAIKLATWNINSVRLRSSTVARFLKKHAPDVLCLQETKVPDALFPAERFRRLGYVHQAIKGQKGYHGVAILSRLPFRKTEALVFCGKDDTRHVSAVFEVGLETQHLRLPAGRGHPASHPAPQSAPHRSFFHEANVRSSMTG